MECRICGDNNEKMYQYICARCKRCACSSCIKQYTYCKGSFMVYLCRDCFEDGKEMIERSKQIIENAESEVFKIYDLFMNEWILKNFKNKDNMERERIVSRMEIGEVTRYAELFGGEKDLEDSQAREFLLKLAY